MSDRAMMFRRLQRSRLWSCVIALLMVAQLALAFHSLEHKFSFTAAQSDECALCQVASTMAPGPAAEPPATPVVYELVRVTAVAAPCLRAAAPTASFQSRAPPISISV